MLEVGILGAARIAPIGIIHPAQRRNDVHIHAVAAARPGAAAQFADEHNIPTHYASYDALIADEKIDVVYIALPPNLHAEYAIKALEAGKHVLCEKPFALNVGEVKQMQKAAEISGRRLIEAFHNCYHPIFAAALEIKNAGRLGDITSLNAIFSHTIPFSGAEFRHSKAKGGGALMDLGCYPLHWVRNIMGAEPSVVSAKTVLNKNGADVETSAELLFGNNVPCTIETSMQDGFDHTQIFTLNGTKGSLTVVGGVLPHLGHYLIEEIEGQTRQFTVAGDITYDHQLDAVVQALKNNTPVRSEADDTIGNMALIEAIMATALQ